MAFFSLKPFLTLACVVVCNLAQGAPAPTATHTYDLCARAMNQREAESSLETLHIRLTITGPEIDETLRKLAHAQLLQAALWPGQKINVYLEDYDPKFCAASGTRLSRVELAITQAEVDAIHASTSRGADFIPSITSMAARAKLQLDAAASANAQKLWLQIWYATNRQVEATKTTDKAFANNASPTMSYGSVEVGVKKQARMKKLETSSIVRYEHVTKLDEFSVAGKFTPMRHEQWLTEIKQRASRHEKPGVLLFIHGFNNSFVEAAARAGQLTYDLAFPGPTIIFAWPSQASALDYDKDEAQAAQSTQALAALLDELTRLQIEGPVYVVAHSMGNRIMLGGLTQMLNSTKTQAGQRRALSAVVMAAPDVPQQTFKASFADNLIDNGIKLTLYASGNDNAMKASQHKNGARPLGLGGKGIFTTDYDFESIDASLVSNKMFGINHAYYGDNDSVLGDLFYLIRKRLPAEKRPNLRPNPAVERSWVIRGKQ
jgi:esterase/lipase superfamily enzyme